MMMNKLRFGTIALVAAALLSVAVITPAPAARSLPLSSVRVQQEAQTTDTAQVQPAPTPIPASDIARRYEETDARLRVFRDRVALSPDVIEVAEELPEMIVARQELAEDSANLAAEDLTFRRLENLRRRWRRLEGRLDAAEAHVAARSRVLEEEGRTLSQLRAIWQVTLETASERGLPPSAMERVNSMLSAIEEADSTLRARLDFLVALQNQIAEVTIEVSEQLERVVAAQQVARTMLFRQDAPYLWEALRSPSEQGWAIAGVRARWEEERSGLADFIRDYQGRVLIHLAIFTALFLLLIALRRRSSEGPEEDDHLAGYAHILARPASSSILVSLLLTPIMYGPNQPVIGELFRLVAVLPVLRLLPAMLPSRLHGPLYMLALVYLINQVSELLLPPYAERFVLLLVAALALAGAWWVQKAVGQLDTATATKGWRAALLLARLVSIVLVGSLVTNILGNVLLAELLTDGGLDSAMAAAVVVVSARVLDGVVILLIATQMAQRLNFVRRHKETIIRRAVAVIYMAAVFTWGSMLLLRVQLLGPLLDLLKAILGQELSVGSLNVSLGDILAIAVAIWITVLLSRFVRFMLAEDVFPRVQLPRGVGDSISKVVHYTILALGGVIALAAAGIEWQSFALIAGALGIGIGFGLQNLVNNFVSGMILIFERPIQLGDTVEFGTRLGVVKRIGIRSSTVRTFDGAEVIVPNGNLISAEVVNWTLSDRLRRLEIPVGVAYGTDIHRVLEILVEVAQKHPDVLDHPAPQGLFRGFGDSSLDFVAWLWTANFDQWRRVGSEVAVSIHDALAEAGITIPFPQRDLHLKSIDSSVSREIALGGRDKPKR
jgi:small-conductance mechanosensitive channel